VGSFSIWHWLIVLAVVLLLFGAGKLPRLANDLAQGIKNFRKGMQEETDTKPGDPHQGSGGPGSGGPDKDRPSGG
jgi:sec-independent protein translocase protein TatA